MVQSLEQRKKHLLFFADPNLESRLNHELANVDGFTKTIAGYLSELKQESFSEDENFNTSTTEKLEVSFTLSRQLFLRFFKFNISC